jgi:polyisoprenoid-binding protein YceI
MAWQIDPAHSQLMFSVRHLMVTNVRGEFDKFTGTVEFDEQNVVNSKVDVQIEATSINTKNTDRDNHLRSADFLDAANHPYLHFQSKRVIPTDGSHGRLVGDLTVRGVTREVTLDVEYVGSSKTPWGTINAGFNARTRLNRKDWGLTWNAALETGGVLVGDEINVSVEIELVKSAQPAESAAATA